MPSGFKVLVLESKKKIPPQLLLRGNFCQRSNIKSGQLQILFSVLGDPRTNQNPALLTFGILFFRWHNVVASRVQHEHPDWSDEDVFQRARRVVIATLQVIEARRFIGSRGSNRFFVSEHYLLRVPSGIPRRRVAGIRRI